MNAAPITCPMCNREVTEFVYKCQFRLTDGSAHLDAILYHQDGVNLVLVIPGRPNFNCCVQEQFFYGLPPVNLYKNNISAEAVQKKLNMLLQPNTWLDCCLVSYQPEGTSSSKFRIFDTTTL